MAKCSFCGKEQDDYKGLFLFKNDGTSVYFCSSKCRKNSMKLRRDKRKVRWTEAFHAAREKRMAKAEDKEAPGKAEKKAK